MNGDIKLATLSDTDDTDVTGSELVTNGTFDTDISGWTDFGDVTSTHGSGTISSTYTGSLSGPYQAFTTVVGKTYVASAEVVSLTGSSSSDHVLRVGNGNLPNTGLADSAPYTGAGVRTVTFTATGTTSYVYLRGRSTQGTVEWDNVSVRLAEPDRSVNGNGLAVYGTITKDPVATGADLVAYSGFSASNYLEQPYNSDLDFGTGDFCEMLWAYKTANNLRYFSSWGFSGTVARRSCYILNDGDIYYNVNDLVVSGTVNGPMPLNTWVHVCAVRQGNTLSLYINGTLVDTADVTGLDLAESTAVQRVGISYAFTSPLVDGSLALLRISATAPTAEQVAKIYNDEKFIFQEGAQATLYGSSDAVTALAHDEVTDLLHVGTSAGRSVFQGLRRVDNTTDAVGVAISAYDGLVVED
jgi:hypothetical protein